MFLTVIALLGQAHLKTFAVALSLLSAGLGTPQREPPVDSLAAPASGCAEVASRDNFLARYAESEKARTEELGRLGDSTFLIIALLAVKLQAAGAWPISQEAGNPTEKERDVRAVGGPEPSPLSTALPNFLRLLNRIAPYVEATKAEEEAKAALANDAVRVQQAKDAEEREAYCQAAVLFLADATKLRDAVGVRQAAVLVAYQAEAERLGIGGPRTTSGGAG